MADVPQIVPEMIQPQMPTDEEGNKIALSQYTVALLESLKSIKSRPVPDDLSKLTVSQTVSLLAIAYEKIRNAIEYREDHLVLRAAIERILKRRIAMNPQGEGEAENLLRELTWARYFANESLGETDIDAVQKIINCYIKIKNSLLNASNKPEHVFIYDYLFEFITCEIEQTLNPDTAKRLASYTYFIYQTLREKIKVEGLGEDKKDAYFLVALDKAYRKSDRPYQRYHLFTTFYKPLSHFHDEELKTMTHNLPSIFKKIDEMIKNPHVESLSKFTKKQLPPFLILFDIIDRKQKEMTHILKDKTTLWKEVEETCHDKYEQVAKRLRGLAIRSLIYIFFTKMLIALILEYPISQYFYGEAHTTSIVINTLTPPILMLIIVLFFKLPDSENTRRVFNRIINIVNEDKLFETQVAYMRKKVDKNSLRVFMFTMVYSITFFITLYLIHLGLDLLNFNMISQALFIFFISVVSFFSYRIKQVTSEYKLSEKEGFLEPVIDFFFLPILSLGKFFSNEIARLNLFIVIFDFIIETPFKMIIDVFEEWVRFVRARKEEII